MSGELTDVLNGFMLNYVEPSGAVQIWQSFSFGEMTIAILLTCLLVVYCLKWVWEVLR